MATRSRMLLPGSSLSVGTAGRTVGERPTACDRLTGLPGAARSGHRPGRPARLIDRPSDGLPLWPGGDLQRLHHAAAQHHLAAGERASQTTFGRRPLGTTDESQGLGRRFRSEFRASDRSRVVAGGPQIGFLGRRLCLRGGRGTRFGDFRGVRGRRRRLPARWPIVSVSVSVLVGASR